MKFCEKLKKLRNKKGISQQVMAEKIGVSWRAYQNYEAGKAYPRNSAVYMKIAAELEVSADYLLSETELYTDCTERVDACEIEELVMRVGELFEDRELSEDDKDNVLRAITERYWQAKAKNK